MHWFLLVALGAFSIMAPFISTASLALLASEIAEPQRLTLTFDPGLVLERLILGRLSGLKRKRGQDWLRSLLAQGFLAEGQWIRSGASGGSETRASREPAVPTPPSGSWPGGSSGSMLQSAVGYRLMGITRRDVEQRTAKALQARDGMGAFLEDVRSGARRAPDAPAIAIPPEAPPTQPMRLQPLPGLT